MNKILKEFTCDYCERLIKDPSHGRVEWESETVGTPPHKKNGGFKIVHHITHSPLDNENGCYHYQAKGLALTMFLGPDQIHRILRFLDMGPIHEPVYSGPGIKDMREYVEFTRRLTIPYYEEARLYWDQAVVDGYFNGQNEIKVYQPDNLKRLIERYAP